MIYRFTVQQQHSVSHPLKLPKLSEAMVLLARGSQTPAQKDAISQKGTSVQGRGTLRNISSYYDHRGFEGVEVK